MESFKYLIIGGGASGTSAAETIRKEDPLATIAIVSDEIHPLYSRVMLSKPSFFLGKIPFEQIYLKGKEWYDKNKIIFIGGRLATSLDNEKKIVTLDNGQEITYDKLLIAIGVRTRKWDVPGGDKEGIYSLRNLEDGKKIMEAIKTAKKGVTVGGGFISFEMADLLKQASLETTMLLRESYFWEPTLDETSGQMIEKALEKAGVSIKKNVEVKEILGKDKVEKVLLNDGTKIDCEMIICGIGITMPPIEWMQKADIKFNKGILANEYLETNVPDIWTSGDIAEYKDLLLEENIQLGNWVNAHEQGRVAGLNMTGKKTSFKFVSFYTTQGVGVTIAFVGDSRPLEDRVVITRGGSDINSYGRILTLGKEIIGATMINRTSELTTIAKLIENNTDISDKHDLLSDPNFNLKDLLPKS